MLKSTNELSSVDSCFFLMFWHWNSLSLLKITSRLLLCPDHVSNSRECTFPCSMVFFLILSTKGWENVLWVLVPFLFRRNFKYLAVIYKLLPVIRVYWPPSVLCFIICFLVLLFQTAFCRAEVTYSRQDPLKIRSLGQDQYYSGVLLFIQHLGVCNKERRLFLDYDPNEEEAEAAQGA